MIIPIKCFTCGTVLADKYAFYCEEVRKFTLHKKNLRDLTWPNSSNINRYVNVNILAAL